MEQKFDSKADIWSLGILLFELCELEPPLMDYPPMQVNTMHVHYLVNLSSHSIYEQALFKIATVGAPEIKAELGYSANLKDFASQCLSRDPNSRPSAAELLEVILRCIIVS